MDHPPRLALMLMLLAAGCGRGEQSGSGQRSDGGAPAAAVRADAPARDGGGWSEVEDGLAFASDRAAVVRLACAPAGQLVVNLPRATPVGSEERLSFGGGGDVVALVADPRGDASRGGVSGTGPVPAELAAMLKAGPGASYGATAIGPLPPVEAEMAGRFVAACRPAVAEKSPCRIQDGKPIDRAALRLVGTEPFWGAAIEGRCVTYSTPEDIKGTRVWTRWTAANGSQSFAGALGGMPFRLTVRESPGCSDGMSDRRYPMAATLTVAGEQRRGCAEPR
jgi:uncharacterized membrane protein